MKRTGIISAVVTAMLLVSMCGNAYAAPKKSKKSKEPASKTKSESTKEPARTTPKSESKPASSSNSSEPVPANATSKSEAKKEAQKPAPAPKDLGPNSEDDFDFEVNDDITEITITGYHGTRIDVVLPTSIQDVPVVWIDGRSDDVFTTGIRSLVVPDNINIGSSLFKDKESLVSITIGNGTYIGRAFEGCPNLPSVSIGKDCMIGSRAFADCEHLESITIGKDCTVCSGAFMSCKHLESLTIGENTCILDGEYTQDEQIIGAFVGCSSLQSVNLGKNIIIGDLAFAYTGLKSVVIPKGCNRLGFGTFAGCSSLESVSFPEGLTIIAGECFRHCSKLAQVHLPSTLKYIAFMAFDGCPIASVDFLPEGLLFLGYKAFTLKHDDAVASSIVLPKSLKWFESTYKAHKKWERESILRIYKKEDHFWMEKEGDFYIFKGVCDSFTVPDGCTPKMLLSDSDEFPEIDGRDIIGFTDSKNLKFQKQLANFKIPTCCASKVVLREEVKKYKSNPNYFIINDKHYLFTTEGKALYADLLSCGFTEQEAKAICAYNYCSYYAVDCEPRIY